MKTKNLLPNHWKPIGWGLLTLCIFWLLWAVVTETSILSGIEITIPWPFNREISESGNLFDSIRYNNDGTISLEIMDELLSLGLILGLLIVGFARVRNEDERTAQMRLEALQWAIYGNTIILAVCIIFIYGMDFLSILIYNMFTPLLIFVLRFHWLLYKESKAAGAPEGSIMAL